MIVRCLLFLISALCATLGQAGFFVPGNPNGTVCRVSDASQGGCLIDGTNCDGDQVDFVAYNLTFNKWNDTTKNYTQVGIITSHGRAGAQDTWQMYLHGPKLRPTESVAGDFVAPFYVSATFTNKIYKFENITKLENGTVRATQKMVGNAVAPSTVYPIEDTHSGKVQGLLVAEGNPFWVNSPMHPSHMQVFKGGVTYLDKDNCTDMFPLKPETDYKEGKVVNTVDCHEATGVCFFSVWKFYDDQPGMWSNKSAPDCLWVCTLQEGGMDGHPKCVNSTVLLDEEDKPICHVNGLGAVHGFTIGNTVEVDNKDNGSFDLFLMYTGGATFDGGHSMLRKINVQVSKTSDGPKRIKTLTSEAFGEELFKDTVPPGHDVGGDHAWVDESGKYVWVSTFRVDNPGVHMMDYTTGKLLYSIHGMDSMLKGNYAYSAGIDGFGRLGKSGSTLAVATSACTAPHSACFPMPWLPIVPKMFEGIGIMYILDIGEILDAAAADLAAIAQL